MRNFTFVAPRSLDTVLLDALAPGDGAVLHDPSDASGWQTMLVRLSDGRSAAVTSIRWDGGPAWKPCSSQDFVKDAAGNWCAG
ncbi:hypothetical protein [Thioalkalivibrio sp. ALE16]|uniref:hypothetical protein n=1 Tax=Thioalkalivibrio sp. ALE16 TaxID=1158172 RepID=UPI000361783C|nr:hypothetical protein [Thioalkalivibrio sp. ALE16]